MVCPARGRATARKRHSDPRPQSKRVLHTATPYLKGFFVFGPFRACGVQKHSAAAGRSKLPDETHLDVSNLCQSICSSDEAIRSGSYGSEQGIAIRAGQERVRALHKHHLLTWARGQSRLLTYEAQQRARTFDKIETANRALDCIDSALRIYPEEPELHDSKVAISEFSLRLRWLTGVNGRTSAFKGPHRGHRSLSRCALLFEPGRGKPDVRAAGTQKIEAEIAKLQAQLPPRSNPNQ